MASSPVPWIVGGLAVGVGFIWWRKLQADAAAEDPEKKIPGGDAVCAAAQAAGKAYGYEVSASDCNGLLSGVADLWGGLVDGLAGNVTDEDVAKADAQNKSLNGAIELPYDKPRQMWGGGSQAGLWGTVLRFANGCVPFKKARGWEKCKPGTVDMLFHGGDGFPGLMSGVRWDADEFSVNRDPMTFGPWSASDVDDDYPAPVALKPGETFSLSMGKFFTCPGGAPPDWSVVDHRSGHAPPCGPSPFGGASDPNVKPTGTLVRGVTEWKPVAPGPQPPGYVWNGTAWVRAKAGTQGAA